MEKVTAPACSRAEARAPQTNDTQSDSTYISIAVIVSLFLILCC